MSKRHELTPDATRPTDHDQGCAIREGIKCYGCDCGLVWRQRIFDLERRVKGMPEVGEPDRSGSRVFWNSRPGTSAGQIVEAKPGEVVAPYGDVPLTPEQARWLAAALLAAADEGGK